MGKQQTPTQRINAIDVIRGFALIGILLFHCMEQFDLMLVAKASSPTWQAIDGAILGTLGFLVAGKSYAIFSLLFGLSFFMQMDKQADKGCDFRLRFAWRLVILFLLGYLNGLVYMGEFFVVYAILGLILIPLYRVGTKYLIGLSILLFLQIPDIISLVSLLNHQAPNEPWASVVYMNQIYEAGAIVYKNGSLADVLSFNMWQGQLAKLLWTFNNSRYLQLIGLFIVGMLIGRSGIYKQQALLVKYSRLILPYTLAWTIVFYAIVELLPYFGLDGFTLQVGRNLFKTYTNLGMMMFYISGLILLYYQTSAQKYLNYIAPLGRMSVTNYMAQSLIGVSLFYSFGGNLAAQSTYLGCFGIGLAICTLQIIYSNWWMKRHYFGPLEHFWRVLTWGKMIPNKKPN